MLMICNMVLKNYGVQIFLKLVCQRNSYFEEYLWLNLMELSLEKTPFDLGAHCSFSWVLSLWEILNRNFTMVETSIIQLSLKRQWGEGVKETDNKY